MTRRHRACGRQMEPERLALRLVPRHAHPVPPGREERDAGRTTRVGPGKPPENDELPPMLVHEDLRVGHRLAARSDDPDREIPVAQHDVVRDPRPHRDDEVGEPGTVGPDEHLDSVRRRPEPRHEVSTIGTGLDGDARPVGAAVLLELERNDGARDRATSVEDATRHGNRPCRRRSAGVEKLGAGEPASPPSPSRGPTPASRGHGSLASGTPRSSCGPRWNGFSAAAPRNRTRRTRGSPRHVGLAWNDHVTRRPVTRVASSASITSPGNSRASSTGTACGGFGGLASPIHARTEAALRGPTDNRSSYVHVPSAPRTSAASSTRNGSPNARCRIEASQEAKRISTRSTISRAPVSSV